MSNNLGTKLETIDTIYWPTETVYSLIRILSTHQWRPSTDQQMPSTEQQTIYSPTVTIYSPKGTNHFPREMSYSSTDAIFSPIETIYYLQKSYNLFIKEGYLIKCSLFQYLVYRIYLSNATCILHYTIQKHCQVKWAKNMHSGKQLPVDNGLTAKIWLDAKGSSNSYFPYTVYPTERIILLLQRCFLLLKACRFMWNQLAYYTHLHNGGLNGIHGESPHKEECKLFQTARALNNRWNQWQKAIVCCVCWDANWKKKTSRTRRNQSILFCHLGTLPCLLTAVVRYR